MNMKPIKHTMTSRNIESDKENERRFLEELSGNRSGAPKGRPNLLRNYREVLRSLSCIIISMLFLGCCPAAEHRTETNEQNIIDPEYRTIISPGIISPGWSTYCDQDCDYYDRLLRHPDEKCPYHRDSE